MYNEELQYNHIQILENNTCIVDNGLFCQEWVNTKDIALPMSFFVLLGLSILIFMIFRAFIKKR